MGPITRIWHSTMSTPHVMIVGGGLGGLALAQGFRKHNISFTLFERDQTPSSRAQGYRIRLSGPGFGGGTDALQKCLDNSLWDLFKATCADIKLGGSRFNAIDGSALTDIFQGMRPGLTGTPSPPYSADRTMLRSLLLLGQDGNVKFGKTFQRYEETPSGVKAFFSDGTSEEGSLLIGADGVTSPIRRQFLPNQRYFDSRSRAIFGKTPLTPELTALFPAQALQHITVIQDQQPLTLFLEPIRFSNNATALSEGRLASAADYVYWVIGGSNDHFQIEDEEFHSLSGKAAAELTISLTENWLPGYKALLQLQQIENTSPLRLITAKPERPDWTPSTRVTLLGDAAHAMMPAGGSGANAALADAASLLDLIVEEGISEAMMAKYVDGLWERALPLISRSTLAAEKLLGFGGYEGAKEVDF